MGLGRGLRAWSRALAVAAAIAAVGLALAAAISPTVRFVVQPAQLDHAGGASYVASVAAPDGWLYGLYELSADTPTQPSVSRLRLDEDGRQLGPAHAVHAEIGARGGGAFSHWGGVLYFSATDNSDPRINGRRYEVEVPLALHWQWKLVGIAAAACAVLLLGWVHRRRLAGQAAAVGRYAASRLPAAGRRGWSMLGVGCGGLLAAGVIVAAALAPEYELELEVSGITHDRGYAFVANLPVVTGRFYELVGDSSDEPRRSTLALAEDGRLLGLAHAAHAEIRDAGGGRYSHWHGALLLSTSDNSDPRVNGRRYTLTSRLVVRDAWRLVGWIGLALVLVSVGRLAPSRWLSGLSVPRRLSARESGGLLALAAVAGVAAVGIGWVLGPATTNALELARYFPISDASGYHSCATALAGTGAFHSVNADWCARRTLYVTFLATVLPAVGWSSQTALLLQGALVGASIGFLIRQATALSGALAALIAGGLLAGFAWQHALGVFMTEVLGFSLGLTGLALLLVSSQAASLRWMLAGTALVSAALTARAGAMFILPALVLWAAVALGDGGWVGRVKAAAVAALAAALGPLLHFGALLLLGHDPGNSGGNYAASLYALSIGSRSWTDAYRDFGPLFAAGEAEAFRTIYGVAFQNMLARPEVFANTLWQATGTYFDTLFPIEPQTAGNWVAALFTAVVALGLLRAVVHVRKPWGSLLLLLAAAEVFSAPFIIDSGGLRVFAASVGLRIVLAAVGLQWLASLLRSWSESLTAWEPVRDARGAGLAAGFGAALLATALLAATPLLRVAALESLRPSACPAGEVPVVARVGRESVALTVNAGSAGLMSIWPFVLGERRLLADASLLAGPFGADVKAMPRPVTLVRAVDLSVGATQLIRPLALTDPVPGTDRPLLLCTDPAAAVTIANVPFSRVRSARPLGSE